MATLLPATIAPPTNPVLSELEATLVTLPAEWTLMVERRIGGIDGPYVAFVLLHAQIGVALVDLAPSDLSDAECALDTVLAQERLSGIPIVAITVSQREIAAVGETLAEAFAAVSPISVTDLSWPETVIDVLMTAGDAAMLPLTSSAPAGAEARAAAYDESGHAESAVAAAPGQPGLRDERPGAWLRSVADASTIVALIALAVLVMEMVLLPQDRSAAPPSPVAEASAAREPLTDRSPVVPAAALTPPSPAPPVASALPSPDQENAAPVTEISPPLTGAQSPIRVAVTPRRPIPAKHRARPRPPVGRGNDPAAGRFYDSGDSWLSWRSGVALPGAPGISNGGG